VLLLSRLWLTDGQGHSLGGALASLAAVTLRSNIHGLAGRIRLFTFGKTKSSVDFPYPIPIVMCRTAEDGESRLLAVR